MNELNFMITIADRARIDDFISLYNEHNITELFVALGKGTAGNDVLAYLGLESSEKAVCFGMADTETWQNVKKDLERKIKIDIPGIGIAFTVPLSSIGGQRELMFFTDGQNYQKGEETVLKNTVHELLVIIANQGYNDAVMDAARAGGAAGGTVIHAKGTGKKKAEKFLGISLASEKEIIFIVTDTSKKNAIMRSVMEKAGLEKKAKAIVFSLPVTSTAGLRLLEETDNEKDAEAFE